ncbi:MAG: type II toxin-antitoxin system HigB family toxin [Methylococcaceae bacterium]|nr:type II toxin-antitoxin system HigB family toxin [Methylococcaceae bacterium]
MRVISNKILREFAALHPDAQAPLQHWRRALEKTFIPHFSALKAVFGSVDQVGEWCVFNVGGNKYRLIAFVDDARQCCYVKHVLTHRDYDLGRWKHD